MTQISINDFQEHKIFVGLTIILAFLYTWTMLINPSMKPELTAPGLAFIEAVVMVGLISWWFQYFWNIVVKKLFPTKEISFGVALLIISALTFLLG